ncbi:non-hydrolyzing UDP-N-acetylglucosamine 2-epimerase [Desulfuromonas sp. TF]|uniref:non-hydrolyzing UDP-N-acetylglucosamine 2-epimerase n=1 Tax=Desulfuromonas sp. TF TaxID=1232410 RepID=UPI000429B559
MKILVVIGTRPEAIKMAPVIKEIVSRPGFACRVCTTGQHQEMLQQVLQVFDIVPDNALDLMQPDQSLSALTASVLNALDRVLLENTPDLVLVQGDTTSVLAAALAARHRHIRVGHVEAGLRTWDCENPFPEEINRQLVTRLSALHFAPTWQSADNLLREGIEPTSIHVTGNPVIDALHVILAQSPPPCFDELLEADRRLILITAHRRENFGHPLEEICNAVAELARRHPDLQFVYPVHLNPNVQKTVKSILHERPGVKLLPPVDYVTLVHLVRRSTLILTDSGGIQEEAPSLGVPVLVLRETTERPEGVAAGTARLVGTDRANIIVQVESLLHDAQALRAIRAIPNPYGDGCAARRIVDVLAGMTTSEAGEGLSSGNGTTTGDLAPYIAGPEGSKRI